MYNRLYKKIFCFVLLLCFVTNVAVVNAAEVSQRLDYTDSLDSFNNPERGFYEAQYIRLKESGGSAANPSANLVHLRIDLSEFSDNATIGSGNGTSEPLTDEALKNLADTFENIRKKGHTVIVRACYDYQYNGKSNYEPSQEMILQHLQQLAEVYSEYADVIAYVELGMYGPWGEMHTSKCCTKANVTEALNTLLEATPDTIKVGVRRPDYVADWLGVATKDFDVKSDAFKSAVEEKGKLAYRVGMYNDGYLGSSTDLGTYGSITREKGVEWLDEFAKYTLYGGECVANSSGGIIGDYNTIDYISKEAFNTHTAYLNIAWNNNVIAKWKSDEVYTGDDEYNGQTAFKYINDHLGYRFVMRDSVLPVAVKSGDNLALGVELENVGFGNIVNSKKVTVVLKNSAGDVIELTPKDEINPCEFLSKEISEINTKVEFPDMKKGQWNVYLRISKYGDLKTDNNYQCIRFGNSSDYWDSNIGANYIGSVTVVSEGVKNADTVDKADAALVLKLVSGIIDKSEFAAKYNYSGADSNGDGQIDIKDVIALINAGE
jgi:hypothetical protein